MADNSYAEFARFQTAFFTNTNLFNQFTYYEIKKHSFMLLNTLSKGFPVFAQELYGIYSPDLKILESPAIIIALHHKYCNDFAPKRVPQFVYFKQSTKKVSNKKEKASARKTVDKTKLIDFDQEIKFEIMERKMLDSKSYEYLKYSPDIQLLGKILLDNLVEIEKTKMEKAKTKK